MIEIAKIFNMSPKTLRNRCKELGLKRRSFQESMSNIKKKFYSKLSNRKKHWTDNPKRTRTSTGYIQLCVNGEQVYEHRKVWENYYNVKLNPNEEIHHLNGIRDDNRIENLALVTNKNHPRRTLINVLQNRIKFLESKLNERN